MTGRQANAGIGLRLMAEDDIPMLHAWLQRPHIVAMARDRAR